MDRLQLAFSTCPNDTFMFDALVNGHGRNNDLNLDLHLADIEELNTAVVKGLPDISKMSVAAFPLVAKEYELLHAGAAIGFGNGPLVVSRKKIYEDELKDAKIAIPGEKTTANLLLRILFPGISNKQEYLFSAIEEVVLDGECDAGLLIHETRFTYEDRGLQKVVDLGEEWEVQTGLPIPLGIIAIRRSLSEKIKLEFEKQLQESVRFALDHPAVSLPFMKMHAQELSEEVMYKHVQLYVNHFSVDVGAEGEKAVVTLLHKAADAGLLAPVDMPVFLKRNNSAI